MAKKKKPTKKKARAKTKKTHKKTGLAHLLFAIGAILILALIGLVVSEFDLFDKPGVVQNFSIEDKCSVVMGNLIHQIRDEGDCRIKCINECQILESEFDYSSFSQQEGSCNICECNCK